nr:MAG TPA_asm: hypothetical protein [Caudoviricetes sp.]
MRECRIKKRQPARIAERSSKKGTSAINVARSCLRYVTAG